MILSLFDGIKSALGDKISSKVRPEVDSTIFKAVKFGLLITATSFVVVTARNYIGESINCTTGSGAQGDEIKAINSYCFITSTFTLSNLTLPNVSPHPGVGPIPHREFFPPGMQSEQILEEEETVTFHAYYQWVPFMLGLQGALLYIPTDLWRLKEDNYLERLLMDTHKVHVDKKDQKAKSKESAEAFHNSLGSNMKYLLWFIACEMLACAFSIANLFLTDAFLGGKFFDFGKGALSYLSGSVTDPNNPLNIVFPKVGKCTWYKFGPTGSIVSRDAICVLPLNIVNEKTYVILWLVYIILCAFTCLVLLYHCFLLFVPGRLGALITRRSEHRPWTRAALDHCSLADKFILWKLQNHIVDFAKWTKLFLEDAGLKVE